MLLELHIENLAIIERETLLFTEGLTAITGASGAGKSLVVNALSLACGARGEPSLVRQGADEARIDVRLLVTGDDGERVERVLSRVIPAEGRSRAYIDGRPTTLTALAELSSQVVEIHGQHEQHQLNTSRVRCGLLDVYGGIDRTDADETLASVVTLRAELESMGGSPTERLRELDLVDYQLAEIDAVNPKADELDSLLAEERVLSDLDQLRTSAEIVYERLSASDDLRKSLKDLSSISHFDDLSDRLRSVIAEVDDIAATVRGRVEALSDDPDRLEAIRERVTSIRALCRRYGNDLLDVLVFASSLRERAEVLRGFDARSVEIQQQLTQAQDRYSAAASKLRSERLASGPTLARDVTAQLQLLDMPHAQFDVAIAGDAGEHVEFLFSSGPSEQMVPLSKVASGGELARCMLAIDIALGPARSVESTVFDEVDAGVDAAAGGAIASALAASSLHRQVLVVTHLPTVAARADRHLCITKSLVNGRQVSVASALHENARPLEIARMLSGGVESDALNLAERLLGR